MYKFRREDNGQVVEVPFEVMMQQDVAGYITLEDGVQARRCAHLECRVVQDVKAGDHRFVIGEVLATYTRPGVLDDDGLYDLSHTQLLLHLGRNRFTSTLAQSVEPSLPKGRTP